MIDIKTYKNIAMKTRSIYKLVFLLISLRVIPLLAQPTPPPGMRWEVVPQMTDEFNNGFDTGKWQKPLWNYQIPVQMLAQNSGVSNGNLWIKATLNNNAERWFQTSRVMSNAQIKFPMYTECSMRTAHISAYNTFWFNNGDINNRDEIDIVENNSKPSCGCQPNFPWQMNSQYFLTVNRNDERDKGNFDNRNLSANNPKKGIKWNENYHTVGMWWIDNQNVQFYLDGEPAGKIKTTARRFTRNQNMIWDLWTFDATWLGGLAVKSDLLDDSINTMYVDWVHTYKLIEDNTLSVAENTRILEQLRVYPNPAKEFITIESESAGDLKVEIYDSQGKFVKSEIISNSNDQIAIHAISAGIYFVKISKENMVIYKSIIKE